MLDSPRFDAGVTYQKVASGRRGESGGEGSSYFPAFYCNNDDVRELRPGARRHLENLKSSH